MYWAAKNSIIVNTHWLMPELTIPSPAERSIYLSISIQASTKETDCSIHPLMPTPELLLRYIHLGQILLGQQPLSLLQDSLLDTPSPGCVPGFLADSSIRLVIPTRVGSGKRPIDFDDGPSFGGEEEVRPAEDEEEGDVEYHVDPGCQPPAILPGGAVDF